MPRRQSVQQGSRHLFEYPPHLHNPGRRRRRYNEQAAARRAEAAIYNDWVRGWNEQVAPPRPFLCRFCALAAP